LAHLQGAIGAVQRLLDGVDARSPMGQELWDIEQTIFADYRAMVSCDR
jgi:hypothetical protein